MYVADLVDDEQGVDKIAADPKVFVSSERVGVGDQELVAARDELGTFFIAEHFEAVDPGTRFGGSGLVVGVGCVPQRAHRMKIGKGELLHCYGGPVRRCWRCRRGSGVLGDSDSDL